MGRGIEVKLQQALQQVDFWAGKSERYSRRRLCSILYEWVREIKSSIGFMDNILLGESSDLMVPPDSDSGNCTVYDNRQKDNDGES